MLVFSVVSGAFLLLYRYLQEYSALGTAGGMYHFRDQILTGNPDLFFVMNADVCGDFPLQEMLEFHQSVDTAAHFTILATEVCYCYIVGLPCGRNVENVEKFKRDVYMREQMLLLVITCFLMHLLHC